MSPWAEPKNPHFNDCYFYHTMDLPVHGEVGGEWDLRKNVDKFLGKVSLEGKRVLDVGTASGFLSFTAEKRGAKEVVSYDIDENQEWDVVPYPGDGKNRYAGMRKEHIRKLNNGYWYNHRALKSKARMMYGTVYDIPKEIGKFDVAIVGNILIHLRDPWLALRNILDITEDTVVITECIPRRFYPLRFLPTWLDIPWFRSLPCPKTHEPLDSWWMLTPAAIRRMIGVMGFGATETVFHRAPKRRELLFTVTGYRTA